MVWRIICWVRGRHEWRWRGVHPPGDWMMTLVWEECRTCGVERVEGEGDLCRRIVRGDETSQIKGVGDGRHRDARRG